jgi:hypothetical protein
LNDLIGKGFLYSAKIGFEFEFYSNLNRNEIAEGLSKSLNKKVKVFDKYHSKFQPTANLFKLEPDYSGGSKMVELITGPLAYFESLPILIKTLNWINQNGYTDSRCAFQFNISFDQTMYPDIPNISDLNILKFVLGFDENYIYKRFPDRSGSLYAKSIKRIIPSNKFVDSSSLSFIDKNLFEVPLEKNMGINFLKLPSGYIEVRYLGGDGYQTKYSYIRDVIEYVINYTRETLESNTSFSDNDLNLLKRFLKEVYKNATTLSSPAEFEKNYPNLGVMIDLRRDPEILKSFFINLRDVLYDIIVENGITEGLVNYDSNLGKYQLKDVNTPRAYLLDGYDIINSTIAGNLINCRFIGCKLRNSTVEDSDFINGNEILKSKILYSDLMFSNAVHDSYIDNKDKEINCEVYGGIIRSGYIGKLSTISEETEIVGDDSDDKKMKGSRKKILFPDRNDGTTAKQATFKNNNSKPSGIPGINFEENNN